MSVFSTVSYILQFYRIVLSLLRHWQHPGCTKQWGHLCNKVQTNIALMQRPRFFSGSRQFSPMTRSIASHFVNSNRGRTCVPLLWRMFDAAILFNRKPLLVASSYQRYCWWSYSEATYMATIWSPNLQHIGLCINIELNLIGLKALACLIAPNFVESLLPTRIHFLHTAELSQLSLERASYLNNQLSCGITSPPISCEWFTCCCISWCWMNYSTAGTGRKLLAVRFTKIIALLPYTNTTCQFAIQ